MTILEDTSIFEEHIFNTILSRLQEAVIITTPYLEAPHPLIVFANQHALDVTGYSLDEVAGKSPRIFQGKATNRNMLDELKATLQAGKTFKGETTNYRKDGTPYHVEVNISPLVDETGEIIYFLGIQRDLDAEKALLAAQLEASHYRLQLQAQQQVSDAFTQFANGFAQQLRDPLSVIRLNAETMHRYNTKLSSESITTKTATIIQEIDYLTDLLTDVKITSKLIYTPDAAELTIKYTSTDVCMMIDDIIEGLRSRYPERANDLTFTCLENTGYINIDSRLLRYIFTHIAVNALTYSEPGTPVNISLYQTHTEIEVTVADRGYGIPQELQSHLFDPFYRAPNAAGTLGTGLGLTIVKTSLDLLDGHISLDSQEGYGTTFTISIPLGASS